MRTIWRNGQVSLRQNQDLPDCILWRDDAGVFADSRGVRAASGSAPNRPIQPTRPQINNAHQDDQRDDHADNQATVPFHGRLRRDDR